MPMTKRIPWLLLIVASIGLTLALAHWQARRIEQREATKAREHIERVMDDRWDNTPMVPVR